MAVNIPVKLYMQNFVAKDFSRGLIINSKIPKPNGIKVMAVRILKLIICGNRFVYGIIKNDIVASNPEITMSLNPNLRPLIAIHVFLPPALSPSISGISTLIVNKNCNNIIGTAKIKN